VPEYEVRVIGTNVSFRVLAESEQEAAETVQPMLKEGEEAYVYRAELPVGWEGTDPEEPDDDPRGPNPV
jgi:hypothetical protein